MPTITVKQTGKTSLSAIASSLGVSLAELKKLNPQLERGKNFNLIYNTDTINLPDTGSGGQNNQAEIARVQAELAKKQEELRVAQEAEAKKKEIERIQNELKNKQDELAKAQAEAGGNQGTLKTNPTQAPAGVKFTDSAAYKSLTPELQQLVNMGFNVLFEGGEAEAQTFADSLTKAQALADPYAKSQLAMAKAEIGLSLASLTSDYEAKKAILDRTRTELADDLKTNKEALSLEEQADMARALRGYDTDMLDVADQAAEKGLTFATGARSRALAEERRTTEYQDVVQSTRRQYNLNIKQLELKAARGDQDAIDQLNQLNTDKSNKLQQIGLGAEKLIGSMEAGSLGIPGYNPVGGTLGDIEQNRRKSILDIASLGINT